MSAIVAVATLDADAPPEDSRADLDAMARALAHRGKLGEPFVNGRVALGVVRPAPASAGCCARGALVAAIDARLDDPLGVAEALGADAGLGDAALLLIGWERWGAEVVARAVGDFAAVIWDADRRELHLLRDGLGARPLYFAARGSRVFAATEAHALAAPPRGVEASLDRREAARFLVEQYAEEGPTLFAGVEAVPSGSVVSLRASGRSVRRGWSPDPFARLSPSDPGTCAERFREALDRAVRARLPGRGAAFTLVSGGLDSSSVHVLAARARAEPPRILHVAFPGLPCDEAPFVGAVAAATGAAVSEIDPRAFAARTSPASPTVSPGEIFDPSLSMLGPLFDEAGHAAPGAIVLTGAGGDDLLHPTGHETVDDLRAGRLAPAWRSARSEAGGARAAARYLLRQAARAVWPEERRRVLRRLRPARWVWPEWLTEEARRTLDAWHEAQMERRRAFAAPSEVQRRLALSLVGDSDLSVFLGKLDLFGAHHGVELRHPFYDRRLVELMLALPRDERASPAETKGVLRRGLVGLLPELVRRRTDAADFSPYVDTSILGAHREAYERHFEGGALEQAGVVRRGALAAGLRPGRALWLPWRAIGVEVAFRTFREARASYASG